MTMPPTTNTPNTIQRPRHSVDRASQDREVRQRLVGTVHNLDREVLNPSPCEQHMDTDLNSHASETIMESYPNIPPDD